MYQIPNKAFKERIEKYLDGQHFMKLIGFQIQSIEPGRVEGVLDLKEVHRQQRGLVHGGLSATLADIVAGFAAYTVVPEDHHVVTAEIKVSYLNPGIGHKLYAVGWVLKQGRKMSFCEAEIWCENQGRKVLIAKATTTMATIFPGDVPSPVV
ncbi:PaaI family thioesterase [Cytophagales bacterium LB-30]|uniref:PaaI family thioesterase n=1 Tax=Shiella aurantiaca TaxID=3058365 RepID=A0ABT8F1J7_9BACT|nr:PaaI family thioesterase [Shiella aurantiaca]MDN4164224.1 PaaI family thioesterase [Shiella aurantiaca]